MLVVVDAPNKLVPAGLGAVSVLGVVLDARVDASENENGLFVLLFEPNISNLLIYFKYYF